MNEPSSNQPRDQFSADDGQDSLPTNHNKLANIGSVASDSKTPVGIGDGGLTPINIRERGQIPTNDDHDSQRPLEMDQQIQIAASQDANRQSSGRFPSSTRNKRTKVSITPQNRGPSQKSIHREGHPGTRNSRDISEQYLNQDMDDEMSQRAPGAVILKSNLSQGESKLPVHRRSLTEQGSLITAIQNQQQIANAAVNGAYKPEIQQNSFGMLQKPSHINEFDQTNGSTNFNARRQSYDQAKQMAQMTRNPEEALLADRSGDQSHLSGFSVSNQSPLLEEVRKNNFSKVSKLMDQFLIGKENSGTITGRDSQQRRRNIKNSFQTIAAQRQRSGVERVSTKFTDAADYPGAVGPKKQIGIPKNLVLYQLSKNVDAKMIENSISHSAIGRGLGRPGQQSFGLQDQKANGSFLDFLEGSVTGTDIRAGGLGTQSHGLDQLNMKSPFGAKSFRTIDANPNSILDLVRDATNPALANSNNLQQESQPSNPQSIKISPSAPSFANQVQPTGQSPVLTNFHITDLLERSIILGAREREHNKLRQIIEFYKRSVKGDAEIHRRKEIMIRNYRLHVVKDSDAEISDVERSLFNLNKGTSIHVSNSIVKPEIHKFGTQITDKLSQVYANMLADPAKPSLKKLKRQRGAHSVTTGLSERPYSQADGPMFDFLNQNEEQDLLRQEMRSQRAQDRHIQEMADKEQIFLQNNQQTHGAGIGGQRLIDQLGHDVAPDGESAAAYASLDDGLSSRAFTPADAEELAAITETNKIFDRWLRNIMSAESVALPAPTRAILKNGREAAPQMLDINWQIAVANKQLLKEKPIPLELMTNKSFYDQGPYRYLQLLVVNQDIREWYSKFILKTQTVQTYSQIVNQDLQSLSFSDAKMAIDFSRHHLTHLDEVCFKDDTLALELFLDYDRWIRRLAKAIKESKIDNELRDPDDVEGIPAKTHYYSKKDGRSQVDVKVLDFDPFKAKFLVKNSKLNILTWRSRLYVKLLEDTAEELEAHKLEVMRRKAESLQFLRVHRLIIHEMTKRYNYLKLPNQTLQQIQNRLAINLLRYSSDSVRKIILQIEALYVFAILKSTLSSQRNDPFIKRMLLKYRVQLDSPALNIFNIKSTHKEKSDLDGIKDYNMKGTKVELDNNSLLLMNEKYIKLPIFLNELTQKTIGAHKLFKYPFDVNLLLAQNSDEFRRIKKADLEEMISTFPLHHDRFVQAQKIMSKYFHQIAKFRWSEAIQREIWSFVKDDFDIVEGKEIREDQIDPVLLRLFYQLKLYMQTIIFDHFETALCDYMRFLLSFIIRDAQMKDSAIIEDIKYNEFVRLSLQKNQRQQIKKGEVVNDILLVPLQNKPMILIATQIDDFDVPNKIYKKQKVVTRPELSTVHKDLFSIILNMHGALENIDRIDAIVFPLLQLDDPHLQVPDVKNNEKLTHYIRIIDQLIEQSLESTKEELKNVRSYMYIFDKRVDNIILDLKKRSFEAQQLQLSENEGDANKKDAQKENDQTEERDQESIEEDVSYEDDDDDDDADGEDGYQGNEIAYKSVDIDDELMKEDLFFLRDLIWKVRENIYNQYDFGMVYLDCVKFKDRILNHIQSLINHLEHYVRSDFTNRQKTISQEIVGVQGKLDMEVKTIDDVIFLLDYIESLKKQDNKIGDISGMIEKLADRMELIEGVQILFPNEQYSEFLNIRNWPRTFKQYIEEKKEDLLAKKEDLYKQMSKEIDAVFEKIAGFQETIKQVVLKGLIDKQLSYDSEGDESLGSDNSQAKEAVKEEETEENKKKDAMKTERGVTFPWLAEKIKMSHKSFNIPIIEETFHRIEILKSEFDEVEKATALINKRETLLGVQKTQFSELRVIQDDLKPLFELWLIASKYCRTLPQWVEGRFDLLDASVIEATTDEWINELKRLQKTSLVQSHPEQQLLQKFMFESLAHFKKYSAMLRALRTKGLAPRHWRQIGQKLEFVIDPGNITLWQLIQLELYDEEKLKTIKQICEIATKEYAVEQALANLEKEMKSVEFDLAMQTDGETYAVMKLPELITMFEEFFLRASVLRTNPHIRSFWDRVIEIEKIIRSVVDLINEWATFQRHFLYLNSIFVLEEIAKALASEYKIFLQVQTLYVQTTQGFQQNPQVYKINGKENFLSSLAKSNSDCEQIRSGLMDYLEKKRGQFARLFFLSNEELIDIFGKGADLIESMLEEGSKGFITTIFEGIDQVRINEHDLFLTHMIAKDGEEVALVKQVMTRQVAVDSWLKQLENNMRLTVKENVFLAFEQLGKQSMEEWVTAWPGQATFLSSQIWFTMKIISIFQAHHERGRNSRLTGVSGDDDDDEELSYEPDDDDNRFPVSAPKKKQPRYTEDGELIDSEAEEERQYFEEVQRQIRRDEDHNPERACLEKIMRLKIRFRVDTRKLPLEQMDKVKSEIAQHIMTFTQMVRQKQKLNVRHAAVALLTGYVHQRDILQGLIKDKVYKVDEFKWQMQFKFELKNMLEVVAKESMNSQPKRKLETKLLGCDLEVFGNFRQYAWEYLGNCSRLVVTPLTERCQRSLLVALQYHYGGAPEGPFGTGKTETTKDLSRQIAKLCFVLNCSANFDHAGISRFFKGLASSGAWVVFDEFNRTDPNILSQISQVIISIQGALKAQQPHVQLDENKINLQQDCAVFITLNPGYAGRAELPMNLKALFRPISMVVPDSVFITEILLYSSGFVGALQLAKKIVQVQSLANIVMSKADIAHDFGLRSIKAIIAIAEALKLQAQNIIDSELPEIIDDYTLGQVAYQAEPVIKEIMAQSQARIAKATDPALLQNSPLGKTRSIKGNSKKRFGEGELVQIGEGPEIETDSNVSPTLRGEGLGGTIKDINKREGLQIIGEDSQGIEQDVAGLGDSEISLQEEEGRHGELYKRLWGHSKFNERQTRAVYKQIGIDPDQHYDEEELEEYIILKAVRDFNHSKFATEEHIIIEGVIKDVFQGAVPDLDKPVQDYGNLKDAINQSFATIKIDYSPSLKVKALQFYEIQNSKHGCIFVGEPQSGKSTLISLLQSAINKAAMNEFQLTVQEQRRKRLIDLAADYEKTVMETTLQKTQQSQKSGLGSSDMMGGASKKKSKKNDKDAQAKKLYAQWQDMYRQTKLNADEIDEIRANLRIKGVCARRLNPKGMTLDELFGVYDKESHEWHEGLFTSHYRDFSQIKNDKKKWILLDGPIDYMWVENLNSILDDNKQMSLPNGESIKMSEGMCILLETNNLKNVTPATVSRCGLIHLHRKETCNPKAIFNQWLRKLPPSLGEYVKDLENSANYLMVEAIAVFEEEQKAGTIAYSQVELHWLMQNLVRILDILVFDFYIEYEKSNTLTAAQTAPELGKSLFSMTLNNKWVDSAEDPNMTEFAESVTDNASIPPPSRQSSKASQRKVPTPDPRQIELEIKKRFPRCSFLDSEIRYENALKFTPIWLESFFIYAMVWTFYPVLSEPARKKFDRRLSEKYEQARTDFPTYQREKKKKMAEKNREKSHSNKQSQDKSKSVPRGSAILSKQSKSSASGVGASLSNNVKDRDTEPTNGGYTSFWTDQLEEKPMLISDYPEATSFFDYWFNLESSQWNKFSLQQAMDEANIAFQALPASQKNLLNFYVPSYDSVRYGYLMECNVTNQVSTLVVGPTGSGRSALLRETLFTEVFSYTKQLVTDHVTVSGHTNSTVFKENVERLLEWRKNKQTGLHRLRPHLDNKLICYIEDMHLCYTDPYGDQPAIEAIRDYLTQAAWLSSRKRRWRDIEDVSFFACMSSNAPSAQRVSNRLLHRFNLIVLDEATATVQKSLFSELTEKLVLEWPSAIQMYSSNIVDALVDLSLRVFKYFKPTPMKVHHTFSWRDIFKILLSFQMVEANSLRRQENVMKLFYHECYRNYGDRLLMKHDRQWYTEQLEEVCRKHFWVVDEIEDFCPPVEQKKANKGQSSQAVEADAQSAKGGGGPAEEIDPKRKDQFLWPIKDPEQLYFSLWNQDLEGFYVEVDRVDEIQKVIEGQLERYNDSNERVALDLMLFNQLNRVMLKMLRIVCAQGGHLINVAMKGYGMNSVIKLVTFTAGHLLKEIEVYEGFQLDEWQADLRRTIIYCGTEDKPATLFIDEYKLLYDQMYSDLECILRNHMASEITRKNDIMTALTGIFEQIMAEKRGQSEDKKDDQMTQEQADEKDKQLNEQEAEFSMDSKKMMLKFPHVQAECHKLFLNRVRRNFHLILQYTPTGGNLKQKLLKHQELLYHSQMLYMNELPVPELEALGRSFFKLENEKAEHKAVVDGTGVVKLKSYSVANDKDSQERVLRCIVKMYLISQDLTKKYAEDQGQVLYMTPTMFLRVFSCYRKLLKERQVVVKDISARYDAGLEKIRQTQDAIYRYHEELERRSPVLQEKQRILLRRISEIEEELMKIKSQRDQLKRDESLAQEQSDMALRIKEQCEEALNKITPSLAEATNSVTELNKKDVAELKSMKKPPKVIKLVLQTVCMLLGIPPIEKKSKKTGKTKLSYWKAAQGKELLGNPNLPKMLLDFDQTKVTPEVMMAVEEVLLDANYSYEKAYTASAAATGFFKWVNAARTYFVIFKEIEPRRDAYLQSEQQFEFKQRKLEEKTAKIGHLDTALDGLKGHQKTKDDIIEELRAEIQDCNMRKQRADVLLKGLSAEKQKWIVCTRMLSSKYTTVTGDVLLSAGYITLIGGFDQKFRNKVIQKWTKTLNEEGFQCSKEFVFTELFGDSYKIRKWHINHLPHDTMSVNNALVIEKTKRFTLLLDPQMQGITWLKSQFDEAGSLTVIKQDDPSFKKTIELAVETGRTVIVEQIETLINMNLQSLLKKLVTKHGGQHMLQFSRKTYKFDKNFKLFVVSRQSLLRFDVNVTNHVTLLNFSVNVESLQAQMLGLVVLNERKDLEDTHSENSKEAFDSIKSLKDIEAAILTQLDMKVHELLGEDILIRTLNESKNTAEYVASKLKNIAQTNQFIQRSRETYAPVAYRAAVLFFIVQDLQKINNMYQFSLSWFKSVFVKSLELTNALKEDTGKIPTENEIDDDGLGLLNNTFSVDERIELLIKTFTQELTKKVLMSVFEEDRKLVTYLLVLRVLESESFIDRGLLDFIISGSKSVSMTAQVPEQIKLLPWLDNMMWADLQYLANIKPFNSQNLLNHFISNQEKWNKFCLRKEVALIFDDLPNRDLLDLRFFSTMEEDEFLEETGQILPDQASAQGQNQSALKKTFGSSLAARTANDSNSRGGSRGQLRRTESEILRDPDIWNLSDSDDEDGKENTSRSRGKILSGQDTDEGENDQEDHMIQQQMARYLVESAPGNDGMKGRSNIGSLRRKTTTERTMITKRERTVKGLAELCILRCIRPDHVIDSMDRFVYNVINPHYFNFEEDILEPILRKKGRLGGQPEKAAFSAVELTKKILGQSKMTGSKMSATGESQAAGATSGSKLGGGPQSGQLQETNKSGLTGTMGSLGSGSRKQTKEEQEQAEKEAREARGGMGNIKNLMNQAFEDSDPRSPVLLLVTQAINVHHIVQDCMLKKSGQIGSMKLWYFSLGKGVLEEVEEKMSKAAQNGDWIVLENLHQVLDWLPSFEEKIAGWKPSEVNPRFRIWITSIPVVDFPRSILERSIKLALQQPKSIKQKMIKMLMEQEKEQFFRRSGKSANIHKNLFFGLAYLHACLDGRKKYGTLGFNLPYAFDHSDFEVSQAQLTQIMKNGSGDHAATLEVLKYFYAHINYAGKIQRVEDQVTLNAIVDDLFNDNVTLAAELDPDRGQSHYGFPTEFADFYDFVETNIPLSDPYDIFGFHWNIESHLRRQQIYGILSELFILTKSKPGFSTTSLSSPNKSIAMTSLKTSLRSSTNSSGDNVERMLKNDTSLLNLFIALQQLLGMSSLDSAIHVPGLRYDHFVDQEVLPKRDLHDKQLSDVCDKLLISLDSQFDRDTIQKKYPIRYKAPLNNIINRELAAYRVLLKEIRISVEQLRKTINGAHPRPEMTEELWTKIQENRLPQRWLKYSFQTSHTSLADYLVDLGLKIEFWQKIANGDLKQMPSFWLPAFFDPRSFLTSLIQTKSRLENAPMTEVRNEYEVLDTYEVKNPPSEKNVKIIHGLYLEGAEWDFGRSQIVDMTGTRRFTPFPAIRVRTLKLDYSDPPTPDEAYANLSVNKQKAKRIKKKENQATGAEVVDPVNQYRCPIYKTKLRLSPGLTVQDNAPVEYLKLDTLDKPSQWTKRAVALLLQPDMTDSS